MNIKVLVVDDDEINRMVLNGILDGGRYDVFFAENGAEGVEVFEKERPDIVLMDVLMPVMDGRVAATKIKELAGDEFVPVIFLTSLTDEDELAECVSVGGDDFLTKPFSKTILEAKITAFLRTRVLYQQIQQHNQMMMQEYLYAEKIFARLNTRGVLKDLPFNHISTPQSMFNGDMLLAAKRQDGGLNVFVGDATGHGLPAAIGVLPVSDIFYDMTEHGRKSADIVLAINQKLKTFLPTELFLCACLMEFSLDMSVAKIWNGGLPDGLIYNARSGDIRERVASNRLPLGIMGNASLDTSFTTYHLKEGDSIYVFSDGITEAEDENGDMLGMDGLERCLIKSHQKTEPFNYLSRLLAQYRGDREQSDDLTLIQVTPELFRLKRSA
ncbi:MAG: fused response regulator/phosphatase [Gammaproteobacteria bacterium]|nr:fused response regulator/phosphatase [Gammaproteobacteria bacterium]